MRKLIYLLSFLLLAPTLMVSHLHANEKEHEQHAHENHTDEHESAEHADHDEHSEAEDHHEHGEENNIVGPGKGIESASEKDGIRISAQAEKNFEIKRTKIQNLSQIEILKKWIVTAGTEVNLYRYRDGHYKRIDFITLKKSQDKQWIKSAELKAGDEIVTNGMGLLRIAEIAAFGGAPEGHSH